MVPVSGSAYTYTYGVLGEFVAWIVGWALGLEYGIGAATVCVGWSGYMNGLLMNADLFGLVQPGALALPEALRSGPMSGGTFNLLAFLIGLAVTVLLYVGTSKSARVNSVLVAIKIVALTMFIFVAFPAVNQANFEPYFPGGWGSPTGGVGVLGAAASIFFAYVGFDAVSTAAEETKNPQRNIPIGLIGSLAICTIYYLLVGYSRRRFGRRAADARRRRLADRSGQPRKWLPPAPTRRRWSAARNLSRTSCVCSGIRNSATGSASPRSSRCRRSS